MCKKLLLKIHAVLIVFVILASMLVYFQNCTMLHAFATVYPDGWQNWKQWDTRWARADGCYVKEYGCVATSYAIAFVQAGLIEDENYNPGTYITWAHQKGYINNNCYVYSHDNMCLYDPNNTGVHLKVVGDAHNFIQGMSYEDAVTLLTEKRNQGYIVLLRVKGGGHTLCVGDPYTNDDGKSDIHLYDPGWSDGLLALTDSKHNFKLGALNYYTVLERTDGQKCYPGETNSTVQNETAEAELAAASQSDDESPTKLYRLSRYNEKQKQSMAILQNKSMTNYELAAFKWNMIVSQFTIPYVNNIYDVLDDENWKKMMSSLSSISFEKNPYLEDYDIDEFTSKTSEYLEYLKTKSSNVTEVMKLLNDKDANVYTALYGPDKSTPATVGTLLNSTVLYVKDHQTLIGSAIGDDEDSTDDATELVVDNQGLTDDSTSIEDVATEESTEQNIISALTGVEESTDVTENNEGAFEIDGIGDTTVDSRVDMWTGLQKMYDISIGDAKTTYATILQKSTVQETTVPVFIATDATELYNQIFISNAMELYGKGTYSEDLDESTFVKGFSGYPIYIDSWGNICMNVLDTYIIVYPSYANPLLVSTELEDDDIAGVYYETLMSQLESSVLKMSTGESYEYLFTTDLYTQMKVSDAKNHINNYEVGSNNAFIGYGEDSFKVTTALNDAGEDVSNLVYDRLATNLSLSENNPPMFRFDTTTFPIANRTFLVQVPYSSSEEGEAWYDNLSTPYFKAMWEFTDYEELVNAKKTTDGKLSIERYGVHTGFHVSTNTVTGNYVNAHDSEGNLYKKSLLNGNNIVFFSDWNDADGGENVVTPIYNYPNYELQVSGSSIVSSDSVKYPFMSYLDGLKGMYIYDGSKNTIHTDINMSIRQTYNEALSATYVTDNTYDSLLDALAKTTTMYENIYALEYIDSERFNVYFTLNGNMDENKTRVITGSYLESLILGIHNVGVKDAAYKTNTYLTASTTKLTSVPILATTIDDTSGWGVWTLNGDQIDRHRDTDSTLINNKGFLKANEDSKIKVFETTVGLKYTLSTYSLSNTMTAFLMSDILTMCYVWDTYYIPNSPLCTRLDLKGGSSEEVALYDANVILTPFNGIDEKNNNTLFWTRETNGSTSMNITNSTSTSELIESKFTVNKDIYKVDVNVPLLLLAINKNADNTNLQRWVDNLEDAAADEFYIMDLIAQFYKHPITGMRNFTNGLMQYLHTAISKSSIGSIFNIQYIFNLLWNNINGLFWFFIIYGTLIVIGMVVVGLRFIFNKNEFNLIKKEGRVVLLGTVPIIIITSFAPLFNLISAEVLRPVINKTVLTELEGYKRASDKLYFGVDGEVLLEDFVYDQEEFDTILVPMLTGFDENNKAIYSYVSLLDLYKSVSIDCWDGKTDFSSDEEFNGLRTDTSKLWYNNQEYVPVHYDKYADSVFYYFYDWIKSNYIQYYSVNHQSNGYEKPDSSITESAYRQKVLSAEQDYMSYSGGIIGMYTDEKYINIGDGMTDLFGLSMLFKMTAENGYPVNTYNSQDIIEDWALLQYSIDKTKLSTYSNLIEGATDDVSTSDVDDTTDDITISDEELAFNAEIESYVKNVEDEDRLTVSPIAAIINSPYWNYYKQSNYIYKENSNKSNRMLQYLFTPDSIQNNTTGQDSIDFSDDWQAIYGNQIVNSETYIPYRLYASRALFNIVDTSDTNISRKYSALESRLNTLNSSIYQQILTLSESYKDNNISDDTMIFISALVATFEFNKVFGSDTISVCIDSLTTDKVLRSVYATAIEDVIDNPNLVYMVSEEGGLFTGIVFVVSEIMYVLCMYVRSFIYALLIIASIVICFSEAFLKEEKIRDMFIGLAKQLALLLCGQTVLMLLLRLLLYYLKESDSKSLMFVLTLLFGICSYALLKWHIKFLIAFIKNIRSYGNAVINDELNGIAGLFNNTKMKLQTVVANVGSGNGKWHSEHKSVSNKNVLNELRLLRRKQNINKLKDNSEDE